MKVLEESGRGAVVGSTLRLDELGLPIAGGRVALIAFWKRQ
jgi:hypothetical protein